MKKTTSTMILLYCFSMGIGSALGGIMEYFYPPPSPPPQSTHQQQPAVQQRSSIKGDPDQVLAGWAPMGYFNQFYNPSNIIGPEILKGFGVPYAPYSGFNLMETVTTPPLKIPDEAPPPGAPDYPSDLFSAPGDPNLSPYGGYDSKTNYGRLPPPYNHYQYTPYH